MIEERERRKEISSRLLSPSTPGENISASAARAVLSRLCWLSGPVQMGDEGREKKWSSRVLDTVSASHFSQASNHYLHADVYKLAEGFLLIYFRTGNRLRARKSSGSTWRAEHESG